MRSFILINSTIFLSLFIKIQCRFLTWETVFKVPEKFESVKTIQLIDTIQ